MSKQDLLTADDLRAIREAPLLERQALLIRLVEAAYERGWSDCEKAWADYADGLKKPTVVQ